MGLFLYIKLHKEIDRSMKTHDLKLAAFLKLARPNSFTGTAREDNGRVSFLFEDGEELTSIVSSYLRGEQFTFSPQEYGQQLDTCKNLIFQDYKV